MTGIAQYSIDLAGGSVEAEGGLSVDRLDKFLYEIRLQPMWRREADIDAEYYDGNQLDHATLDDMQALGMAPLIRNLIKPTIDVALGMEAKTRADWRVQGEDEENQEVAEALSAKLKEAERASRADRACSDAYAGQLKTGLQWVEVSREMDPFRYPYRVASVSRREIFWDWRAQAPDLSDARYLVRRRWQDVDILEMMFPEHKELIGAMGWSKANWDTPLTDFPALMGRNWMLERDITIPESDWRDSTRKRLCLYEVWYRIWVRGHVFRLPNGRTVEVDVNNPMHQQALAAGMIEPVPAIYPKMRLSWWIGPHRLVDLPSPYTHGNFPYVPFWGYREDLTQIPYGLIRSMRSPQDEVNARLSKMMWLMSAKRIIADADQVDDWEEVRREIARPDAMLILSTKRRRDGRFEIGDQLELSEQQFKVMMDATQALQKSAGIYQAMLGDKQPGVTAGVAINSLVEQGTTTLAEINDNYRYGRQLVGEMLVHLIKEDLGRAPVVVSVDETFGTAKKKIELNRRNGHRIDNDVQNALTRVALEDVPSTPSYRAQQLMFLTEMVKSMAPELQGFIVPFMLEASEMPHRREVAEQVRQALGMSAGNQQYTQAQVQQIVQQEVEKALKAEGLDIKRAELGVKRYDADTKRLKVEGDIALAEGDADIKTLDTILKHDEAVTAAKQEKENINAAA